MESHLFNLFFCCTHEILISALAAMTGWWQTYFSFLMVEGEARCHKSPVCGYAFAHVVSEHSVEHLWLENTL